MIFQDWSDLIRTMVVGVIGYVALIGFLHLSGKRTLSRMNAFDLVVSVALGSTLATLLLSEEVSLAEGLFAFALLIGLQFTITWTSLRSEKIAKFVKATPSLLYYDGTYLQEEMKRERVMETEIEATIRAAGFASTGDITAVILETNGRFSVISKQDSGDRSALERVRGVDADIG